ncbi:hypothetical protein FSP39_018312 [Pinctada imbricata]|uniref:Nucleoporin Nup37 n=1 Tax=Pinctada imbricata TaxID=66713 RepID=A0AA88YFM5_PINIB|nr:hypothetical protein FSP39_018312 [Pinctada imbricata]
MDETTTECFHSIPCHDIVYIAEFAPYEWCASLLAVGTKSRVSVFQYLNEPEYGITEEDGPKDALYRPLCDIQNACRVTSLSWCPSTFYRYPEMEDQIRQGLCIHVWVAAAGSDHRIRVFKTKLQGDIDTMVMEGHKDYINSIAFSPVEEDKLLVSTGDDMTCRIWDGDGVQKECFQLGAAGMSVAIHEREPRKVMVAQKNGVIKIFSLDLQQQIMSYDCWIVPLMGADWCRDDEDMIVAAAGTEWLVFQLSRSSYPVEKRLAHTDGARDVRWSKSHPTLIATKGRPGKQIKVFSVRNHQVPLNTSLPIAYGMSWHYVYPILAVGGDKKVDLYYCDQTKSDVR